MEALSLWLMLRRCEHTLTVDEDFRLQATFRVQSLGNWDDSDFVIRMLLALLFTRENIDSGEFTALGPDNSTT